MASIGLDQVEKSYANGHHAVQSFNLEIANGEFLVLVGPSGCGKTTVLRMIAGLETPTQGRIFLGSRDVTSLSPQARDVAMVFQSYALYPHKTVQQNLEFGLRMRGTETTAIAERLRNVSRSLGIDHLLDRKPAQLSGGERQRVALGRAIVREPQAFLLDEPLSNLDAQLRVQMRAELARLHRRLGATMLHVTHDQEEAMTLGDRVAVMHGGRLQQIAAPLELYRRPMNTFVAGFIGSPAMNFFPCALRNAEGGMVVHSPFFSIHLPGDPGKGGQAVLGVRPQDMQISAENEADAQARVDVLQPLGAETILHVKLIGQSEEADATVVVPAEVAVGVDESIGIRFRRDRLHLFNGEDGKRLN